MPGGITATIGPEKEESDLAKCSEVIIIQVHVRRDCHRVAAEGADNLPLLVQTAISPDKEKTMAILDLIGSSPKFRALLTEVERVAPVDSAVLIQGETGTGKEVIASAIHEASPRRRKRFVALNCAAIPSALLESELFGHERGAFTGAAHKPRGDFRWRTGARFFWTKLATCRSNFSPSFCGHCKSGNSSVWQRPDCPGQCAGNCCDESGPGADGS